MGVKTVRGAPEIAFQKANIPFKHFQRFVSGDSHNGQVIKTCPPHVHDGRMAKVREPEPLNLRSPARCVEGCLDGGNRLPVHQEDMRLVQVADFIQFFQSDGQATCKGDTRCAIGFSIFRFELNQPRFQVNAIPGQVQDFSSPHASLVGREVNRRK